MTKLAPVLLMLLLAGCASAPIEQTYYLLRSDTVLSSRTLQPSREFAIGNLAVAPYIDQQGLLLETASGEIRPAAYHLWAEPLYISSRSFIAAELSRAAGMDIMPVPQGEVETLIDLRINQLHGTVDGEAKLVAYWWFIRGNEVVASYQFAETRPLGASGYNALVDAQKSLLSAFADRIAETLPGETNGGG